MTVTRWLTRAWSFAIDRVKSPGTPPQGSKHEHPPIVHAAGHDMMEFIKSDLPAVGLKSFVETYLKRLKTTELQNDLKLENQIGEILIVRREAMQERGRAQKMLKHSQTFRLSSDINLLNAGGGLGAIKPKT